MKLYQFVTEEEIKKNIQDLKVKFDANNKRFDTLGLVDAQFMFSQVEKAFIDTLEAAKRIYERCYALITLISALLIGLVSFAITKWVELKRLDVVLDISLISIFYLLVLGIAIILPIIKPIKYITLGTLPEDYFDDRVMKSGMPNTNNERAIILLKTEIFSHSHRVFVNNTINERRWKFYTACLISLFLFPLLMALIFGLLYYSEYYL